MLKFLIKLNNSNILYKLRFTGRSVPGVKFVACRKKSGAREKMRGGWEERRKNACEINFKKLVAVYQKHI